MDSFLSGVETTVRRVCEDMATDAGMLEEVVSELKPTDVDVSHVTHFVLNWIIYNYKLSLDALGY